MPEVTLLEALYQLRQHRSKKQPIYFEVFFTDVNCTARFGKKWHKVMKKWVYPVQDGPDGIDFVYDERESVSAILSIPGMELYGNSVRYRIHKVGPVVQKQQPKPVMAAEGRFACPECGYTDDIGGFCPNCSYTGEDNEMQER